MNPALAAPRLDARSTYFYVSYSHVPPPPGQRSTNTTRWVEKFYDDLRGLVADRATTQARIGFYDKLLSPGSDWSERIPTIGQTQVFVPLFAPGYFSRSLSKREWDLFQERLKAAGAPNSEHHICPVIWVPMPSEKIPLMARAQELGVGIRGYTEDGLQAMSRLSHLRAAYDEFLQRLADEIVHVAERETLLPSAPPALSGVPSKIHLRTPLVISVLAPTDGQLPPGRESGPYGAASADWRPYGRTGGPSIAEVASTVVEQLDLDADVVDFDQSTDIFGRTPAVVLIDPWIFAHPRHGDDIVTALLRLPAWVRLLAIVDKSDPQYDPSGAEMVTAMNAILATPFRERLSVVENIDTFVSEARGAIVRVLRDYLRLGPVYPPPGPHPPLPRLTAASQADTPGE